MWIYSLDTLDIVDIIVIVERGVDIVERGVDIVEIVSVCGY